MDTDAIMSAVTLSLLCGLVAVALALPVGTGLAWVLARREFGGKPVVEALVLLPLVIPPVVTGYLILMVFMPTSPVGRLLEMVGMRVAFTWLGAALAQAVLALPMLVLSLRVAFESVDPELEEAARSVGASGLRVFFRVTLPMSWHGMVAGCLLALARALGEFGATVMVAGNIEGETRTLPLAIYSAMSSPEGGTTAAGLVVIAIAMACAVLGVCRWVSGRTGLVSAIRPRTRPGSHA